MPNNKYVLIAIGIALGVFVLPMVLGFVSSIGSAGSATKGV